MRVRANGLFQEFMNHSACHVRVLVANSHLSHYVVMFLQVGHIFVGGVPSPREVMITRDGKHGVICIKKITVNFMRKMEVEGNNN